MIPEAFAAATTAREGTAGTAWLATLPAIVSELVDRWNCTPDGDWMHGEVGVIVPVQRSGEPLVLKVSFTHPGNVHEPDAYTAWNGRGAVHLYERADEHYAMLLERAHPTTLRDSDADVAVVGGQMSRLLAIPAPDGLPRLQDRADEWAAELQKDMAEFSGVLPDAVVARAFGVIDELVREQPDVLIHGDLHHRNILSADREPWLAIDPKGLIGDPAYDAVTFMKARTLVLMQGDLLGGMTRELAAYCEAAELDQARVRRWIQLELVRTAYWLRRYGVGAVRRGDIARDPAVQMVDELAINWA
ncbi:aminoglycoside phosphotransferase family protein [Kribbella albertanoniae]|uniref:aminoglycoside phosphotransferase family protein n=1 Tax=Kribbella albertanoniae TaxID=1266829 RepID=UPI00192E096E|nr:aminoglycoside phosphotransferase family protein [Kribbella albertanoniae]